MLKIKSIVSNTLLALFIIVVFLFAIFLLQNTSIIEVNFLIFTMQIPTIVLILVATIVGFFGGYLFAIRVHQLRKKTLNPDKFIPVEDTSSQERTS